MPQECRTFTLACLSLLVTLMPATSRGGTDGGRLSVIVDGVERPRYHHAGTIYIEAIRGRDYSIRLTNPTPHRVAVALSVDGLNSIDARHTDAVSAAKWVLDPWESAEISGWQVSGSSARRFVFTGERGSYGAAIGKTDNLGVIEAVFFRERRRRVAAYEGKLEDRAEQESRAQRKDAPPPSAALTDEYAATGMGGATRHEVESVEIDLDPRPIATVRVRYEFRPQLVQMGVMDTAPSPLVRRERARGFERYCPEP